jgi:hypothetical protein
VVGGFLVDKDLQNFLFLLAGSQLSPPALMRLLRRLQEEPPMHFVEAVESLRRGEPPTFQRNLRNERGWNLESLNLNPAKQVEQLLRHEAHLSRLEAITALTRRLQSDTPETELPRLPDKLSFVAYIERLNAVYGASRVLAAATRLRNERVHTGSGDWKLS